LDFAHMYQVYKPRRGLKRSEDNKVARGCALRRGHGGGVGASALPGAGPGSRQRVPCLQTLGHLEKAVVLELTLKHVKALTNLIEQQQQKIIALQNGLQAGDLSSRSLDSSQEMFRSGFQLCAKEMLQYLAKHDNKELKPSQLVGHLHRVAAELLPGRAGDGPPRDLKEKPVSPGEGHGKNCVPVIQRTFAHSSGEQSGSDTDTDSGYGGELEKSDSKCEQQYFPKESELKYAVQDRISSIKQESEDPPAKRSRLETPDDDGPFVGDALGAAGGFLPPHAHQPPLCLPFYLIPPSATAYLPMLEKCWYPASVPVLYPGLPTPFVGADKLPPPLLVPQRLPSPGPARSPIDSSALLQALKQIPPLNLETKD
ncbi:BHE40 protein, partial [Alectura lathami]|nr:BHE40 protein [Alectura lathami]